jgi:hypothetical protein
MYNVSSISATVGKAPFVVDEKPMDSTTVILQRQRKLYSRFHSYFVGQLERHYFSTVATSNYYYSKHTLIYNAVCQVC